MTSLAYTKSSTTLLGLNYYYAYDGTNCPTGASGNNGQIQCVGDATSTPAAGRSAKYSYDELGRLSTASTSGTSTYPQWGLSWTYDRYGNRTAQSVTAGSAMSDSLSISTSTNQVTGSGYSYDANGNMLGDGVNTMTYDAENRMVTSSNGSSSGAYVYDGKGIRVKKCVPNCSSPTTTTVYIFSGGKVLAEYDNGAAVGSPSRENIYSGSTQIAKIAGGTTTYYHRDHLSNRVVTSSTGTVVEQLGHLPYGENWYDTGSDKWKFTTYERDAESGNDYALARYDVNRFGRFAAVDEMSGSVYDPQSLNRYLYTKNDPINMNDPTGACAVVAGGIDDNPNTLDTANIQSFAAENGAISVFPYAGQGIPIGLATMEFSQSDADEIGHAIVAAAQFPGPVDIITFSGSAQAFTSAVKNLPPDIQARIGTISYVSPGVNLQTTPFTNSNTELFTGSGVLDAIVAASVFLPSSSYAAIFSTSNCGHNSNCLFSLAGFRNQLANRIAGSNCGVNGAAGAGGGGGSGSAGGGGGGYYSYGGDSTVYANGEHLECVTVTFAGAPSKQCKWVSNYQ